MNHRIARTIFVALLCLLTAGAALIGLGSQALNIVVIGAVLVGLVDRLWGLRKRDLVLAPWRRGDDRPWRAHRKQLALRVGFGLLWATTVSSTVRVLSVFGASALQLVAGVLGGALVLWLLLALVPRRRVDLAHNLGLAAGCLALTLAWLPVTLPRPVPVDLRLPVRGELVVLQGGPSPVMNHHYLVPSQRHALDLLWLEDGLAMDPSYGEALGWGQPVLAPTTGEVVTVVDGLPDGELRPAEPAGNHVVIGMADGRYLLLAHLQNESITVKKGDHVEAGAPIGALGNSGNSSMAHLHLQVQNTPTFSAAAETVPVRFVDATSDEGLQRGDILRPRASVGLATR